MSIRPQYSGCLRGLLAVLLVAAWPDGGRAGAISFGPASPLEPAVQGPERVALVDLDRDGDLDVVTSASVDATVAWHENASGDGSSWTFHAVDAALSGAEDVRVADLDGDGDLDLASAASTAGIVAWHKNPGSTGPPWTTATIASARRPRRGVQRSGRPGVAREPVGRRVELADPFGRGTDVGPCGRRDCGPGSRR
jgi:hypothetical protein